MTPEQIHGHYLAARAGRVVLSFMGVLTQELIVDYGRLLRTQSGLSDNARHLLFSTFVELSQNILRYSAERSADDGQPRGIGLVLVLETDNGYTVSAGNHVTAASATSLEGKLAELRPLDRAALKQLHKDRRRAPPPPDSLGAGLGLIEMARHASGPLEHAFVPLPDGRLFFTLSVPLAKDLPAPSA